MNMEIMVTRNEDIFISKLADTVREVVGQNKRKDFQKDESIHSTKQV